jgi:hypothetical protein
MKSDSARFRATTLYSESVSGPGVHSGAEVRAA